MTSIVIHLRPAYRAIDAEPSGEDSIIDLEQLAIPADALREYEKATDDSRNGKIERAISRLLRALKQAPRYYDAHRLLADQYRRSGEHLRAEAEFRRAAEILPKKAEPFVHLGGMLITDGKYLEAIDVLKAASERDPKSGVAAFCLGFALYKTNQLDEAGLFLDKAQGLDPQIPDTHLILAKVFLRRHDDVHALEQLDTYIEKSSDPGQRTAAGKIRDRIRARMLN